MEELKEIIEHKNFEAYNSTNDLTNDVKLILLKDSERVITNTPFLSKQIASIAMGKLMILFEETEKNINVFKTVWSSYFEETRTKPTKQWLDSLCIVLNLEKLL